MQPAHESGASSTHHQSLDLSAAGVRKHWNQHGVSKLIAAMERCEPWAVDVRPEFVEEAERLVSEVQRRFNGAGATAISNSVSIEPALTIEFMGYLRSGRSLALLAWLTQIDPEIPRHLINEARFGAEDFGSIMVERITTLERNHLLSRVFSPERIAHVVELLDEAGISAP